MIIGGHGPAHSRGIMAELMAWRECMHGVEGSSVTQEHAYPTGCGSATCTQRFSRRCTCSP